MSVNDRNGKLIYAGDIIKIPLGDGSHVLRQIVWYRDGWKTQLLPKRGDCERACCKGKPSTENYGKWAKMEVVGNIWENQDCFGPK